MQPDSVFRPSQGGHCKVPRAPQGTQIAWGIPGIICSKSSLPEETGCALITPEFQILLKLPLSSISSQEFCGFFPVPLFSLLCGSSISTLIKQHASSHTEVSSFFSSNCGGKLRVLLSLSKQLQAWRSQMCLFSQIKETTAQDFSIYF